MRSSGDYDRKKKDKVVCLAGCAVVLFFVVAGNFDYDQKKKIQSSVGGKLAVFLLWREIFITTRKKRYITTGKKDTVVCLNSESEFQQPAVWNEVINQVKKLLHVV